MKTITTSKKHSMDVRERGEYGRVGCNAPVRGKLFAAKHLASEEDLFLAPENSELQ